MTDRSSPQITLGGMRFDTASSTLRSDDGTETVLRHQSNQVLRALAARPGETLSKDDLMATVWGDVNVTDDSLVQCISDIRRAIGDEKRHILQTVPKTGYRLIPGQALSAPGWTPARKAVSWAAAAVIALFAAAGLWRLTVGEPVPASAPQLAAGTEADAFARTPAIAVLPFEDLTGEERWARLGRGIATDIANELARNDWLYVTAPESAQKVTAYEPLDAGRELNVRFVLDGTMQAEGETLRVTSRLTDAATGAILWAENWSRPAGDIFAIQDEIITRIGSSLGGVFSGVVALADLKRAHRKATTSLSAYEHLLMGIDEKHSFDREGFARAMDHLESAVGTDPDFAQAWAVLSVVRSMASDLETGKRAAELIRLAKDAADRGYAVDPNDPYVLTRSFTRIEDIGLAGARRDLFRAVEVAPNNADILSTAAWVSWVALITGPDPVEWAERAIELNPSHPQWYWVSLGIAAFHAGEYDRAIEAMKAAPPVIDRFILLAAAEALRGNLDAARAAAAEVRRMSPGFSMEHFSASDEASRPDLAPLFKGARLAGIPIAAEDLEAAPKSVEQAEAALPIPDDLTSAGR